MALIEVYAVKKRSLATWHGWLTLELHSMQSRLSPVTLYPEQKYVGRLSNYELFWSVGDLYPASSS